MIRIGDVARLPGTRIQNRCAVTSSGLEAVDQLMGGGLPIPSLLVVSESESRRLPRSSRSTSSPQGWSTNTSCSPTRRPLRPPGRSSSPSCPPRRPPQTTGGPQDAEVPDAEMRIAWRYKTMPALNSALSAKDKTRFDLSKPMELPGRDDSPVLRRLLLVPLVRTRSSACCSPIWARRSSRTPPPFRPFLGQVRALIQTANVCVMVSVDDSLLAADDRRLLVDLADAYLRLEIPDADAKKNMGLEERYDGRFHIRKLPLLNSIATNKPDCVDLVFEKHRRYVELRILHLPAVMGGAAEAAAKTPCQKILDQF
ncbi:putative elongator complex protein 4 [Aphelenchoides fujianensis]|nr:putative elongator complex protein 4 [Aphelenchoides fujianensis]